MKKLVYFALIITMFASCATSKNVVNGTDYTAEEVELVGYGVGKSSDESTARRMAMTDALGDLSAKMKAAVRTANSNYQKQSGTYNKTLFEAITDVVSNNYIEGVVYKGDRRPEQYVSGQYVFRVEARVNHTILKKNIESVLDELDATDEERDAFRREMFGNNI